MHGGKAPQVKAKAQERLAALVNPAIDQLKKLLTANSEMVSLLAVKDLLDRAMPKEDASGEGKQAPPFVVEVTPDAPDGPAE
jgi:hypothetical protein